MIETAFYTLTRRQCIICSFFIVLINLLFLLQGFFHVAWGRKGSIFSGTIVSDNEILLVLPYRSYLKADNLVLLQRYPRWLSVVRPTLNHLSSVLMLILEFISILIDHKDIVTIHTCNKRSRFLCTHRKCLRLQGAWFNWHKIDCGKLLISNNLCSSSCEFLVPSPLYLPSHFSFLVVSCFDCC